MKAKGSELIFISRIHRNGLDVELVKSQDQMHHIQNTVFELNCLSITYGTYIASENNSYVFKLKNNENDKIPG